MTAIPREAREGLMRAWLDILRQRHPELTWIAMEKVEQERERVVQAPLAPHGLALSK